MVSAVPLLSPQNMTFEEYLDWAMGSEQRMELVDGEVEYMSPISLVHQEICMFLLTLMNMLAQARNLGQVLAQPFVMKVGTRTAREPDILFVATAHLDRIKPTFLDGPGDLCIEIVSPESQIRDRQTKLLEYQRLGVPEYWVIDPILQEALFYRLEDDQYKQVALDEQNVYHSAVMPGLWIKLDWLWQRPLPSLLDVLKGWNVI